jgi:hypothetical protein
VRRFFRKGYHALNSPFPENGWMLLGKQPLEASVPSAGRRAEQVEVLYRATPSALGGQLELRDASASLYTQKLLFSTGRFTVATKAGAKQLSLSGLGAEGLAFARVEPVKGGSIYQQQRFYELTAGRPLGFRFERRPGELLSILVFVASDDESRAFRLGYRFAGTERRIQLGRAVHRLTTLEGGLSGETKERPGFFWDSVLVEQANNQLDHTGRVRVAVGDDLKPGWYEFRLTAEEAVGAGSLWARAVVAGRRVTEAAKGLP